MSKNPHTHFQRGKRVYVILRSGEKFTDIYLRKSDDDRAVILQERGNIPVSKIRSLGIYRPRAT